MDEPSDAAEVFRKAHELRDRHGRSAADYAGRLAAEALARGSSSKHQFWEAVEASLVIR